MRLKTRTGIEPVEIAVKLRAPGEVLYVRPAETFEHMMAMQRATLLLAGLLTGDDALRQVKAALGQRFEAADFEDPNWQSSVAHVVTLLELTHLCTIRWEGVQDEDGGTLPDKPLKEHLALLLRDSVIADRISVAVKSRVMVEASEGNGSAASPRGGAAIPDTAPAAANQAPTAPAA